MDELIKRLRTECTLPFQTLQLMREAADAIEELQKCLDGVEADNDILCDKVDELRKYAETMRRLKCEGWYLQQSKYHDGYQAVATMPLPESPEEET